MPQRRINATNCRRPHRNSNAPAHHRAIDRRGYRYIGMDHFALPDDELACRSGGIDATAQFPGLHDTWALRFDWSWGVGDHQIGDLYCQNSSDLKNTRPPWPPRNWRPARGLVCNADDRVRRAVIQQLICNFSLEFAEIERTFNIDFQATSAHSGRNCQTWPAMA